jgi:hypothetical protein
MQGQADLQPNGFDPLDNGFVHLLTTPAMVTAWSDTDHQTCYLLTNLKYKADIVAADELQARPAIAANAKVEEVIYAQLLRLDHGADA